MITLSRYLATASLLASAVLSASCHDGLLHPPAQAAALVMMTASPSSASAGAREAFDRADRLFVRFRVGDEVRMERDIAFTPSAAQTVVRLQVPLRQLTESMSAEVELRLGSQPLFTASAAPTLSAGTPTPVDLTLVPVVASVSCGTGVVQLASYGQTAQLSGAALFASGDTVTGVPIAWSAGTSTSIDVSAGGLVTALQDGSASASCTAAGISATRAVQVLAVVASIQVAPGTAGVVLGTSLAYVATLFDARGNIISGTRPIAWSSSSTGVASVTAAGLATGVSVGAARIDVTSGTVVGSSVLTVLSPSTAVTSAATGITGSSATLVGSVNPRGLATQGWFEWGTDPALSAPAATPARSVGSGSADVPLSEPIQGMLPNTTYYFRAVVSSAGTVARGATLNFTTPRLPSAVTVGRDANYPQSYVVNGSVTPNGSATTAWFEYGTTPTLTTFAQTTSQAVGSGSSPVTVLRTVSVQPLTTYYVRLVGRNIGGTTAGSIVSFSTGAAPVVASSGRSTQIGCATVDVFATGNPNGEYTTGWFEYSRDASMRSYSTTPAQVLSSGTNPVPFNANLDHGGAVLYFRAAVSNMFGISRGFLFTVLPPVCIR